MFQILHRDSLSRIGELEINGKKALTPLLLPVIHPFKPEPWVSEVKRLRVPAVITNSYTMRRGGFSPGHDIHSLINFAGIVMTDSGTFQEHMYGPLDAGNLEMVNYQVEVNSDIVTIRDVFSEAEHPEEQVERDIYENYRRGLEALSQTKAYLALPVQGGLIKALRAKSAALMSSLEGEYYPIGGIVPLMERYMYKEVVESILISKMNLKTSSVIHAFGAGHPMFFPLLFLIGVDVVDSSAYIKYAKDGRILTETGTLQLEDVTEDLPPSPYLDRYNKREIENMSGDEKTKVLGLHNLYVSVKEIERIREEIRRENIWNYVEYRAHSHPLLLSAYRKVLEFYEYIEKFEPRSRKSPFLYLGEESLSRPIAVRLREILAEKGPCIDVPGKPYSYFVYEPVDCVKTGFGNMPLYFDETYPVAQSIFPNENLSSAKSSEKFDEEPWREFLLQKVNHIFHYQFGKPLYSIVRKETVSLVRSKNTGKIRTVLLDGQPAFSFRASDGLFSLTILGAGILHDNFQKPRHRVVVDDEVAQFVRDGKNVFAKFVLDADPLLRPHDEAVVVDQEDRLIAFGRVLLSRDEMMDFDRGIALKNRIRSKDVS
ncbi:MAG: tRNA guanosine(15) transglycosylase TgtA [Thermoplasmatales archaeon]